MGKGLVWIWANACVGMFTLYLFFTFLMPILGIVDSEVGKLIVGGDIPVSSSWIDYYLYWIPRFRDMFGYLSLGCFISLIIYVIVQSARREPSEETFETEL